MNDQDKTKEQLIEELAQLRRQNTELKTQLSLSQRAEADRQQINKHLPVLVGIAGLDGYQREVNAAFERVLGWSELESRSRPFLEFVHSDDRAASVEAITQLRAGTPVVNFANRNICKDGSYRWINWTLVPVPHRDTVFGIGQDITEVRLAEEALRESEQRMRLHVQQTPLAVIEWDMNARVGKWNPAAERVFGYTAEEALGRHYSFFIPAEARNQIDQVRIALLAKTGGERSTNENVTKDGRTILCEWYITPLVNADGHVIGAASLAEDVTGRKQAETALRESERQLTTLMSNLPGMAYRCRNDPQWSMEFVSDGCLQLTGYPASELLENEGVAYGDIIQLDDRQTVWDEVQQALAQRGRFQLEYRIRTAQGEEKWVWEQGVGVFSSAGGLQALEGFITDITERKRAEEKLQQANERLERRVFERTAELTKAKEVLESEVEQRRQEEAKYRALVESCPDAVFRLDLQGRITFASQRAADLLGVVCPDELVGTEAIAWVPESERGRSRVSIGRLSEEGLHRNVEYTFLRKDGTTFAVELSSASIRDATGKPQSLMAIIRDITERKQAQQTLQRACEELRASEERYDLAVRSAGVGLWDWDIRTGSVYFSPRWKAMFGYEEHEIGDRFEAWDRLLHPDEREWILKFQEDFLADTSQTVTVEYRLRHKDGSYRWIIAHAIIVRDEYGKAIRVVGSHGDITDRKLAEEAVKAQQRALRRMVMAGDRERHLITYELHDGVAQQLLGAKMLFESLALHKGLKSKSGDTYRDGMAALRRASTEVRRLMNWLRTPVLDKFGLSEAIDDVAAQLRLTPGAPEIECCHDVQFKRLEPTLENSVFRIAQEAMTNACRHSKSERIRVQLTQKGDEVTMEVRDWGVGFDRDTVQENRFGLEGIRERTKILGGNLSILSKPGKGTTVLVQFPVIEASADE
jgi:PAS domain S-box-containing protein